MSESGFAGFADGRDEDILNPIFWPPESWFMPYPDREEGDIILGRGAVIAPKAQKTEMRRGVVIAPLSWSVGF